MKKWCIMLAFAMLLLSGCGKQAESTEVATEESNTEEPEPAKSRLIHSHYSLPYSSLTNLRKASRDLSTFSVSTQ